MQISIKQKETITLLQIGTFLEYFDLMLFLHLSVLLDDLFLPPNLNTDKSLLVGFAFCLTFIFRPFGALIFGYIGDCYGRKKMFVITSIITCISCFVIANLPNYNQIGIYATALYLSIRILQSVSCQSQKVGSVVYITEITTPPYQYYAVNSIPVFSILGTMTALALATIFVKHELNWRIIFIFGSLVVFIGFLSQKRLMDTNLPKNRGKYFNCLNILKLSDDNSNLIKRNLFNCLVIYMGWPFCFYFTYIYFIPILRNDFNYSSEDIILHNLFLSFINVVLVYLWSLLSQIINPLNISKALGGMFIFSIFLFPLILDTANLYSIILLQILFLIGIPENPSSPIFIKNFHISYRITIMTLIYSISRALMYVVITLGVIYLSNVVGHFLVWIIGFPLVCLWIKAIHYFTRLSISDAPCLLEKM